MPPLAPRALVRGAGARSGAFTRPCSCCSSSLPRPPALAAAGPIRSMAQSAGEGAPLRCETIAARSAPPLPRHRRPRRPAPAPRASGAASLPGSLDPAAPSHWRESVPDTEYCVLNFYHLVDLPDVHSEIEAHRLFILGEEAIAYAASGSVANSAAAPRPLREVRGRIYLSKQGINCQAGGKTQDCVEYARWVASRPDFQGLRYTLWPYPHGHAHPRLRLKHRPSLISLAGGMEALPITDPSQRATPLEPDAWARMLATAQDPSKNIAVLDVRNDYEWDAGHFLGAERPNEEAFADTPVGGDDDDVPAPLQGRDPDAPVMMYCTGGIRCDVYSAFLRKKGFKNLYTLEGGVQGYLRARGGAPARARELLGGGGGEEATAASAANAEAESDADTPAFAPDAPQGWRGSLFVFDDRLAVAPAGAPGQLLDAGAVEEERRRLEEEEEQEQEAAAAAASAPPLAPLRAAVPCQVCRSADAVLPHLNCANLDCNDLFLACAACRERLRGCCCGECLSAPARLLRPIKAGGHYRSWTAYASPDAPLAVEDGGGNSSNNELDSDADAGDRSVRTVGHAIATGRRREGRLARRARRREAWKAKHKQAEEEQRRLKEEVRRAVAAREEAMMAGGGGDGGAAESERARRLRELLERRRATTTAA